MATLNKVMLIGRLTRDPETQSLQTGTRKTHFGFAVGRSKKNPQTGQWENDPNPLFIDCEVFARPDSRRDVGGMIQQYCRKGDQLYIEGRLQLDQWDDKTTGAKRSKHKVIVENIEFLGGKSGDRDDSQQTGSRQQRPQTRQPAPAPEQFGGGFDDGSDIPF